MQWTPSPAPFLGPHRVFWNQNVAISKLKYSWNVQDDIFISPHPLSFIHLVTSEGLLCVGMGGAPWGHTQPRAGRGPASRQSWDTGASSLTASWGPVQAARPYPPPSQAQAGSQTHQFPGGGRGNTHEGTCLVRPTKGCRQVPGSRANRGQPSCPSLPHSPFI